MSNIFINSDFNPNPNTNWNIFAIERFLREITNTEKRRQLVETYGASSNSISEFELTNNLPQGSFGLVTMLDSDLFFHLTAVIQEQIENIGQSPEKRQEVRVLAQKLNKQLISTFPSALSFLTAYSQMLASYSSNEPVSDSFAIGGVFVSETAVYSTEHLANTLNAVATKNAVATEVGAVTNLLLATNEAVYANEAAVADVEAAFSSSTAYVTNQAVATNQHYAANETIGVNETIGAQHQVGLYEEALVAAHAMNVVDVVGGIDVSGGGGEYV